MRRRPLNLEPPQAWALRKLADPAWPKCKECGEPLEPPRDRLHDQIDRCTLCHVEYYQARRGEPVTGLWGGIDYTPPPDPAKTQALRKERESWRHSRSR